jgi:chromosome segregation ATPase
VEPITTALIGGVALIVVAIIQVAGQHATKRRLNHTLGEVNGRGTVVEMNEEQLQKIDRLQARQNEIAAQVDRLQQVKTELAATKDAQNRWINHASNEFSHVKGALGELTVDFEAINDLRDKIRLLRIDLNSLTAYKQETRQKVKEINSRLDEILGHDALQDTLPPPWPEGTKYTIPGIPARDPVNDPD